MQIIIPAYKPDERLLKLVEDIHSETDYNIIVVNDGSGEEFDAVFSALPGYVTLLVHDVNMGKGRAMKTGFSYIAEHFPEDPGAIIADADGQHLIKDIVNVANALIAHPDNLVLGSRRFTGNVPFKSRWGNAITRFVFALASGVRVYDTQTGLRGMPTKYMSMFAGLRGDRYEYEMNMLLKAAEQGIIIEEVFIETVYIDDNSSSHFHPVRDSFKIYAVIFKFIFTSFLSFLIDYALFVVFSALTARMPDANLGRLISVAAARVISSLCNYFLNKKTVFKGCDGSHAAVMKYYLVALIVFGANYGLLTLMENVFLWNKLISQALSMALTYPISYYFQRMFVFKSRSKVKPAE